MTELEGLAWLWQAKIVSFPVERKVVINSQVKHKDDPLIFFSPGVPP
jgi:hypothetical protein